jgi:PPK2 family polyphosphate:nucleotide phosphotransferase
MPLRDRDLVKRFTVTKGRRFRLADIDPADKGAKGLKQTADDRLARGIARLAQAQEKLYAQNQWALLLIFQAMDAAGKDGTIKHVLSGVDPHGVQIFSFKQPSPEELDHDFLWRTSRCLPERGRIGIFNRSYYEETLVVRVHQDYLKAQHLPPAVVTTRIWKERFEDIRNHERYLTRNGIAIRKFFLHVSREEQRQRFLARLDEPEKHWKFSLGDVRERAHWDAYQRAYEDMIRQTATPHAPWIVVPADRKWFMRLVVADAIVDALENLDLAYPTFDAARLADIEAARRELQKEPGSVLRFS